MAKKSKRKLKILYFDVETKPLKCYIWRLGEQVVRHNQLTSDGDKYDIICIAYAWNDGKPAKSLDWGYDKQNSKRMLQEFDKLLLEADVVIGKNSDRFDNKHINTLRMLNDQPGMPDWTKYTDDLEKQMRKHFALPSNSLDYISKQLGLDGKIKMEFQDWVNIVEKLDIKSFHKMIKYNKKDVEDTRAIWEHCEKHFTPRFSEASVGGMVCVYCGSDNLQKNGFRYSGKTKYQRWLCRDCCGYAGRSPVKSEHKTKLSL